MNRFRYLNTSLVVLEVFFVQGWRDQVPWFAGGSCGFWFQESSLLVFSVTSSFYQCLALNVGTRIELHFRDVVGLWISIMRGSVLCFCTWNLLAINQSTLLAVCSISLFVFATWGLWWWWFLAPAVDLLSATVDWTCYSCSACCCVRCASQNIYLLETQLPLVGPLNKFIDIKFNTLLTHAASQDRGSTNTLFYPTLKNTLCYYNVIILKNIWIIIFYYIILPIKLYNLLYSFLVAMYELHNLK